MPLIKPISDLRNKGNEISQMAHRSDEPIFITDFRGAITVIFG